MPLNFSKSRILILGAGVTGSALAQSLTRRGAVVAIADDKQIKNSLFDTFLSDDIDVLEWESVIVSPGWKPSHPLIQKFIAAGTPLTNEIDLAWQIKQEEVPHQRWFAITGTNGKTTTVEMTAAAMRAGGLHAIACGNVGDTVIDAVESKDKFDVLVLELSSFQIHWMQSAQFNASAILNIADDHTDWHGTFEEYARTKISLLDSSSTGILNADDGEVVKRCSAWKGRKVFFSLDTPGPGEIGVVEELLIDRAFVAATRHTRSRTNKCIIMLAATGLAKSGLLVGSSRAIGSTGSARKRLRVRQQRCLGDNFALECCRQR